jgi:hypothetical protein
MAENETENQNRQSAPRASAPAPAAPAPVDNSTPAPAPRIDVGPAYEPELHTGETPGDTRSLGEPIKPPAETIGGNPVQAGTTRDALDAGVPMLPGRGDEPQGPEDALGAGPKRGDYSKRIGPENYHPNEARPVPGGLTVLDSQRERAAERGDVPGEKGGVTTRPGQETA